MPNCHTSWTLLPTSPVSQQISASYSNNWRLTVSRDLKSKNVTSYAVELATFSRCKRPSILTLPHIRTQPIKHFKIWSLTSLCTQQTSRSPLEIWVTPRPQPTSAHFNPLISLLRLQHSSFPLPSLPRWPQLQQLQQYHGLHALPGLAEVANVANRKQPTHLLRIHHVPTVMLMDTMLTAVPTATKCDGVHSPKTTLTKRG